MRSTVQRDQPSSLDADQELLLVDRARDGDTEAFESLYHRHVGRVYAVCLRLAGDQRIAEECAQDAFVRAWQALSGFRGQSAFGSWLYRIAVNAVLTRQRTRLRHAGRLDAGSEQTLEHLPSAGSDSGLALDLENAIAALPDGARHIFVLHLVEGYRYEDIAELTGLAVGTCKAQVHRARQLLRRRLAS